MHAKQSGVLAALNKVSSACIGRKHAFFNQAMRIITHHTNNLFDPAEFITDNFCFNRIKIDRTTLFTRLHQNLKQGMQILNLRKHMGQASRDRSLRLL